MIKNTRFGQRRCVFGGCHCLEKVPQGGPWGTAGGTSPDRWFLLKGDLGPSQCMHVLHESGFADMRGHACF
eukprot:15243098-Alexandrium_andersonii.AAC.1